MADHLPIEEEIRRLVAHETSATRLSNRLFSPEGLFGQMASTEDERRALTKSPLFKEAQRRIADLRRGEVKEFEAAIDRYEQSRAESDLKFKLERSSSD